jgi:uncharacterized protein YceK
MMIRKIILCFLISSILSGCASIMYRKENDKYPPKYLYPATNTDIDQYKFFVYEGGFHLGKVPILIIIGIPILIDLPLSVLTDTMLMPYDFHSKSIGSDNRFLCNELKFQDYNDLVDKHPNDPSSYFKRAKYLKATGEYESALKDMNKALEIDPDYSEVYYTRALWLYESHPNSDCESALRDVTKSIELGYNKPEAFILRGRIKEEYKNYHGAINDYVTAIGIDKENAWAYYYKGSLSYYQLDNENGALEDLNMARSLFKEQRIDFGYDITCDVIKIIKKAHK